MKLLVGPPGSGKTTRLLAEAVAATREGKRVWWVGLPAQRRMVYTLAAKYGGVLGLEFLSSQQVYYRLLASAKKLKPLLIGTGRLAVVGEALLQQDNAVPIPGEARLFTRTIAELKRFNLKPGDIKVSAGDNEQARLKRVFGIYENLKGERWDYDDFRQQATKIAPDAPCEADVVIVDGFRSLGPLDMKLYSALAAQVEVVVALPEAPQGYQADETLAGVYPVGQQVYSHANQVAEVRWCLRALKADLAAGADVAELAVILPEGQTRAFAALADEFGVPLRDETPRSLADTVYGQLLLDLLSLPDHPTPSKLLAIPELKPLANVAIERGIAGREGIDKLAQELSREGRKDLLASLKSWQGRLEHIADEQRWAQELTSLLPNLLPDEAIGGSHDWQRFRDNALERAKEAAQLASGAHFRAWWAALLQEALDAHNGPGGVALLTPTLASGRRFKKVYVLQALAGVYGAGEHEDYFIPEEARLDAAQVYAKTGLPKRFLGQDPLIFAELLTRGDTVIVTYPEADQNGPRVRELALTQDPEPAPRLPAGSALELGEHAPYSADLTPVAHQGADVRSLQRYAVCPFQAWAEALAPKSEEDTPWWVSLLGEFRGYKRLDDARLELLGRRYPEAALWLGDYGERLKHLTFGHQISSENGLYARPGALSRQGKAAVVYRFAGPERFADQEAARKDTWGSHRLLEVWSAAKLLEQGLTSVEIVVWPLLGAPMPVTDRPITRLSKLMTNRLEKAESLAHAYKAGDVTPRPGFWCRSCAVIDVCREGRLQL